MNNARSVFHISLIKRVISLSPEQLTIIAIAVEASANMRPTAI